jgi:hypothetical protein
MDISDAFLALAKMINYCDMELGSAIAFSVFTVVWTLVNYHRPSLDSLRLYDAYMSLTRRRSGTCAIT